MIRAYREVSGNRQFVGAQRRIPKPTPINIPHLRAAISALHELRSETAGVETACIQRLVALSNMPPETEASNKLGGAWPFGAQAKIRISRLTRFAGKIFQSLLLFPAFLRQLKIVMVMQRTPSTGDRVVLAMASNRLQLESSHGTVRAQCAAFLRPLGTSTLPLGEEIAGAEHVLLFDPLPLSGFWRVREKCRREEVTIIDCTFLLLFYFAELFRSPIRQIRMFVRIIRECHQERIAAPRFGKIAFLSQIVLPVLIVGCYRELLRGEAPIKGLFFTSNAKLTELLRAYLIQCQQCESVLEVMHGIGSIPVERFFASILEAGKELGAYRKHFFLPQVPNLPLYGVFKRQLKFSAPAAVNSYLNRYFAATSNSGIMDLVSSECHSLRISMNQDPPMVVSILGNCSSDGRFLDSPSFRAECMLLSLLTQLLPQVGSEYVIIYVPHPAHRYVAINAPVFTKNQVRVHRSSVFCWLISDLCLSLMSSSLFEASYFGVPAFTPLLPSDEFYTACYLERLHHPRSDSLDELVAALRRWVRVYRRTPEVDLTGRTQKRLGMVGAGIVNQGEDRLIALA